ncbi:hypothetical protein [Haloarchaeobius sp. DT45]|uniref:hypothetical protein n=1 Tax=Haloarchaeobius sp. DT45 TaxID=3446116 RepID=UPI003F6AEA16
MSQTAESDGDGDQPSDKLRRRADESSLKLWLLMDANRLVVAGGIVAFVFVAILVVGIAHPTDAGTLLADGDPVETLFQAFVTAIITGVTLVLTLNQLVLSQELGAVGDQRDRMQGAMSFREDVREVVESDVTPAEPSALLRTLVLTSRDHAEALREATADSDDETLRERVDDLTDSLIENAESVASDLDGATFGEFDVVFAALDYNYSWKIHAVRRLRAEHADSLSEAAEQALADLEDVLSLYGPAREHVKTLYFQWELVDLSRAIAYAAVPALVCTTTMLVFFDADAPLLAGQTLGVSHALVTLGVTVAIAVVPFALLLSYVARIATVTKRTLSIGPFILRETDRATDESES